MEDFLKVGIVTTTHGLKGEVKVFPTTDDPERFLELSYVLAEQPAVSGRARNMSVPQAASGRARGGSALPAVSGRAGKMSVPQEGSLGDPAAAAPASAGNMRRLDIEQVRFFKNLVILKFKDIDDINDVMAFKGKELWIPRSEGQALGEDEYYIADLIGMQVYLEDGSLYGRVKDVLETGANDVYVVDKESGGQVLLPAIHDCVREVDVENARMTVHLMKGLDS